MNTATIVAVVLTVSAISAFIAYTIGKHDGYAACTNDNRKRWINTGWLQGVDYQHKISNRRGPGGKEARHGR